MKYLWLVDYSDKYSIYFSFPKTWVMWAIIDLHDYIMFFLINVFIVVIVFLFYCLWYRYKFLHIGSRFLSDHVINRMEDVNHGPWLEFYWTMIPIVLLFLMGWPSFKVLYAMEQLIDPFHTVIIIGNQWYWTYQYSDFDVTFDMIYQLDSDLFNEYKRDALNSINTDSFLVTSFGVEKYVNFTQFIQLVGKHFRNYEESLLIYDSVIIPEENLPLGYPRLLSVDQVLVLPCNISVRLLVTSADVIHSWALPTQGIKMDAIPGRINQVPFLCNFWGTYWGQCSELCGINHGFMPIEVRVVPFEDYMIYLKLNIAFRYEKFQPMLVSFFLAYAEHLKYIAERDLYMNAFDVYAVMNLRSDIEFYAQSDLMDNSFEKISATDEAPMLYSFFERPKKLPDSSYCQYCCTLPSDPYYKNLYLPFWLEGRRSGYSNEIDYLRQRSLERDRYETVYIIQTVAIISTVVVYFAWIAYQNYN